MWVSYRYKYLRVYSLTKDCELFSFNKNTSETKVIELEGKNVELEGKVKQLEGKVRRLETQTFQPNSISTVQKSIHRTCHEMRTADAFLMSGFYWIDPDGQGAGDDPINVYCDMTTGKIKPTFHGNYIHSKYQFIALKDRRPFCTTANSKWRWTIAPIPDVIPGISNTTT